MNPTIELNNPHSNKKTLHIYTRVSTQQQVEKENSLEVQASTGIEYARVNNFKNYTIYSDKGISASDDDIEKRPQFSQIIKLIEEKKVTDIYFYDETRMSRNKVLSSILETIFEKNQTCIHYKSGKFDFNPNTNASLMHGIKTLLGLQDAINRKSRFQLGNIGANRRGIFTKPIAPFGWEKCTGQDNKGKLKLNEDEANVVKQIIHMYLYKNMGTTQIANYLNANDIPPRMSRLNKSYMLKKDVHNRKNDFPVSNNEWNPGTIISMLKNTILYGKRRFKIGIDDAGIDIFESTPCEPIITESEFNAIQSKMKYNMHKLKKTPKYFKLLSSLCVCGKCGRSMELRIKPSRSEFTYVCNSKRHKTISCKSTGLNMHLLHEIVWETVTSIHKIKDIGLVDLCDALIDNKQQIKSIIADLDKRIYQLNKNLEKFENRKGRLLALYLDGDFDIQLYNSTNEEINTSLASIADQIFKLQTEKDGYSEIDGFQKQTLESFKNVKLVSKESAIAYDLKQTLSLYQSYPPTINQVKAREYIEKVIKQINITQLDNGLKYEIELVFNNGHKGHTVAKELTIKEKGLFLKGLRAKAECSILSKIVPFSSPHFITVPHR